MANRYDSGTVSKFNPLDFKEILLAPTMMRQKHDASISAAEAMRIKTDPYSKHFNRALELKNQMDNEIANNVDTLNKEGYNPTTFQNIIKLNRQYQDLISPTGEIGQINAENINIKKINDEYDKLGKEKNWGQNTIDYWKNKALKEYNEKPLYDDDGRILKYSGPEGVVNKIDYNKRLNDLASQAKMSTTEFANAVTQLGIDEASGYNIASKSSISQKSGSNYPQVLAAYNTLKKEMTDPTSEVYQSMRYEGRDPKSLLDILGTQSDIYKQSMQSTERGNDINPFGSGPDVNKANDSALPTSVYDPSSTKEVGKEIKDIDFSQIGTNQKPVILPKEATAEQIENAYKNQGGRYTYKNVLNPLQQKLYEVSYKRLLKNNKIPKSADMNDPKVAAKIGFYMNNHLKIPTVGNDIIRADIKTNDSLFMGELAGKSPEDRNQTLTQDVRGNGNNPGFRQMIDSETGEKIQLGENEKLDYIGFDSPINYRNYNFGNKFENSVMAHKAQVLDSKGNFVRNVTISRTPQEMKKALFVRSYEANQVYKNAIENLGEWVQPTGKYSGSNNLKTIKVKYNDDGTFQLKKGNIESPKMSAREYYNNMDVIMGDVGDKN